MVDNLLMSGEVALPADAESRWAADSLRSARELNLELSTGSHWLGTVMPVGDGLGLATRR